MASGLLVLTGLILLMYGLELALFPRGDALANALAQKSSASASPA